jgi:hypothetical protein
VLALGARLTHAGAMFAVTGADAAAIRTAFHEEGELSAAIELRRESPTNAKARACARTIARWTPLPTRLCTVTRLRPSRTASQASARSLAAPVLLLITYFDENAGRGRAA